MTDYKAESVQLTANLNSVMGAYTNTYLSLKSSQGIYAPQITKLVDTLKSIRKQIDAKDDVINTFNQELLDRNSIKKPFTFWILRGVSTLQDWVLLAFFSVYALICFFILILAVQSENALYNAVVILLVSFCIGVVIVGSIVRFA
jgi:hypothetical protein